MLRRIDETYARHGLDQRTQQRQRRDNFTIDQQLPGHSLWEVAYVGNRSRDLLIEASGIGTPLNLNAVPLGAFFGPDPLTGVVNNVFSNNFPVNDYRPL